MDVPRHRAVPIFALWALFSLACGRSSNVQQASTGGASGGGAVGGSGGSNTGGAGGTALGGAAGRGGSGGTSGEPSAGEGGSPEEGCSDTAAPSLPLRRLGREQYENSVVDLFGLAPEPAGALPRETEDDLTASISLSTVETYHAVAHDLALRFASDLAAVERFAGCDSAADDVACRASFLERAVRGVLRRPATADDLADFDTVFSSGAELGGDFASGARAVIEVMLQSPEFLYRVELGEPLEAGADARRAGWARPTPHEMAARLSYLFWDTTPDAELARAADEGGLREPAEIFAHAARLLSNARARPVSGRFHLDGLLALDPREAPDARVTPALADLMRAETLAFVQSAVFDVPGDFAALFTSPFTFVNGPLAEHYGIPGVTGDAFEPVSVGPERAGLLTQGTFLASTAAGDSTFPTRRGRVVLERLFCTPIPGEGLEPPLPGTTTGTTRDAVSASTSDAACAGCHTLINQVGFAFENFDGAGLYRTMENSLPIDTSGELSLGETTGRFSGAAELGALVAGSEDAKRCYVAHWMTFAYGPGSAETERCSRFTLEEAFSEGRIEELMLALTATDAFLYRATEAP